MNYKNSIVSHITALIDSYESMIKSNDITKLIELQDELSIYSYRLAEECAEGKYNYNRSYFIRKITHQRQIQSSINSGQATSMNKAQHFADISVQDLVDKEIENESISYTLDLLLKQVNKILDSLRQKISYLKKEYENSNS
jgi:hypothetical protein